MDAVVPRDIRCGITIAGIDAADLAGCSEPCETGIVLLRLEVLPVSGSDTADTSPSGQISGMQGISSVCGGVLIRSQP